MKINLKYNERNLKMILVIVALILLFMVFDIAISE